MLNEITLSIARLVVWLVILSILFVPLERLFPLHPLRVFRKGFGADLCYYFLSGLCTSLLLGIPAALIAWVARLAMPDTLLQAMAALPIAARLLAALVVGETGYYWGHRWCHEIPVLWRFHAVHHSAEDIDFLVNTRAHPFDIVFSRICGFVPIYLLGLGGPSGASDSLVPVVVALIGTVWGFFIHANLRWRFGPLEWLVSTPAFHHWHHTRFGPINHNYASTLPWLDWIFGTMHLPSEAWPASYGIEERLPDSVARQLVHPLIPADALRDHQPAAAPPP